MDYWNILRQIERFFGNLSTGEWLLILLAVLVVGGLCLRSNGAHKSHY